MKTIITTFTCLLLTLSSTIAQIKSSMAIARPSVSGLYVTPEIASKLLTIETIKLEQYSVIDEFDMLAAIDKNEQFKKCHTKDCLMELGQNLNADYIMSGNFDLLVNKIIITVRILDIKQGTILMSSVREFDNQEQELQRMIEIVLKELHSLPVQKETKDQLSYKNEVITSNNVGKINNSGPRVGYTFLTGAAYEFATRPTTEGGLDIFPGLSMIGYQIEGQYVGTENFSALVEGVFNISGLEQSQFIPSVSILNGFRFGRAGWEVAFGPSFGIKRMSTGFFDTKGLFGRENGYVDQADFLEYKFKNYPDQTHLTPEDFDPSYNFSKKYADSRGATYLSTSFVFAFGRTFRSGALNIPINVFYSSQRKGGMVGVSVGFNVMKTKKPIHRN